MNNLQFYDPATTLSHNCILNFVLSLRNGGKTYGCLKMCVNRFLKTGEQFIYLRRTYEELKLCKNNLFEALKANSEFEKHELMVDGYNALIDGKIAGYLMSLSKAYQVKSNAFPKVKYIIYDEFLVEKNGRYLPNEPEALLAFMETVGRMRSIKVLCLANYSTRVNPYFNYFNIYPQRNTKFLKHKTKPLLIHIFDCDTIRETKKKTQMGQLISNTAYGDFMLENNPFMDNFNFIEKPTGFLTYIATYIYQNKKFGEWYAPDKGLIYLSSHIDPKSNSIYSFDTDSHEPNILYIKKMKNHPNIKEMRFAYENGLLRFEDLIIKNVALDLLDLN